MISKKAGDSIIFPKIYSIVVSSKRGTILHSGIYYSLDDAYIEAKINLFAYTKHSPNDSVEIDFWSTIDIMSVLGKLGIRELTTEPVFSKTPPVVVKEKSIIEQIKDAKLQKNAIMKNILLKKDLSLLKEAKIFLSKSELKFLEEKLLINK